MEGGIIMIIASPLPAEQRQAHNRLKHVLDGGDADLRDHLDGLGEPWASWGRSLLAADDAKRRLLAAQVEQDRSAIWEAELDYERAKTAIYGIKEREASRLLFAVRAAAELFPGALAEHLDPVYRRELDATQAAVVELEGRLSRGT